MYVIMYVLDEMTAVLSTLITYRHLTQVLILPQGWGIRGNLNIIYLSKTLATKDFSWKVDLV